MTDARSGLTRRRAVSLIGTAALALTSSASLAARPKLVYDLMPVQVADGVWMIEGTTEYFTNENGGAIVNCALIETDTGMVIVDTGPSLRYGEALAQIAAQMSVSGVAAIFNTHHHPDHYFGNQVFADKPIYALPGTRTAALRDGDGFSDNMYRLLGDWMRGTEPVPPNQGISSSTVSIGKREFVIYPLEGHTGADLAVLDKKTGTLITGDLAFLDRAPTTPSADLGKWGESIDLLTTVNAAAIIPGHGPFDKTGRSLVQTKDYLEWIEETLQTAAGEGLSMVELMDSTIPKRFVKMGAMPQEFHRSVSHLYPDIERKILPLSSQ